MRHIEWKNISFKYKVTMADGSFVYTNQRYHYTFCLASQMIDLRTNERICISLDGLGRDMFFRDKKW